jgi:hypothetical protein
MRVHTIAWAGRCLGLSGLQAAYLLAQQPWPQCLRHVAACVVRLSQAPAPLWHIPITTTVMSGGPVQEEALCTPPRACTPSPPTHLQLLGQLLK